MPIAVQQPDGSVVQLDGALAAGVVTLATTTTTPDTFVLIPQPDGSWAKVAAKTGSGVVTLCVR